MSGKHEKAANRESGDDKSSSRNDVRVKTNFHKL
jgi:hypothetical protein